MSFTFTPSSIDPHSSHHSSPNSMHHQQYVTPSSSTGGSPTANNVQAQAAAAAAAAAQAAANMPLIASIANVKDSRWLTLEVCREYQRGKCTRSEQECKFAHPPTHVEVNSGKVIACFDSLKGKCNRTNPPCKYLHPPQHLRDILLQNGRNNLILRSIAMNIAANHAIYPQTATHLPYPNGAIIPSPLQQTASLASYPHMGPTGPAQSALVFNQAGQTFSIPLHAAHLSQIQSGNPGTAMYSTDGGPYYQPVTQLTAPNTGPKAARTDRLEVCSDFQHGQCLYSADQCLFAHPPAHCPLDTEGLVTVCVDYVKGKCLRETCKYFHPPDHLVAQLKAVKAQTAAAAAATQVFPNSTAAALQYSHPTIQLVHPLTLNSSQPMLAGPPSTYTYSQQMSTTPACSSPLQQHLTHDEEGNYTNGYVTPYPNYTGATIQTIYTRAPSVDVKDATLINSNNGDALGPNGSSSSSTASTGANSGLKPPGTQLIAAPQFLQQTSQQQHQAAAAAAAGQPTQQQAAVLAQHHKRTAIADPKTGIPMAAYPVAAFSYPSPSPLQTMQFPPPYITAVPMTFTGYTSHLPRI